MFPHNAAMYFRKLQVVCGPQITGNTGVLQDPEPAEKDWRSDESSTVGRSPDTEGCARLASGIEIRCVRDWARENHRHARDDDAGAATETESPSNGCCLLLGVEQLPSSLTTLAFLICCAGFRLI